MKYPKIEPINDRRLALMPKQRIEIRRLFRTGGYSVAILAEGYNVSRTTIYRVLDPAMNQRKTDQVNAYNKLKYKTDPEWVKRKRIQSNKSHQYKRTIEPRELVYDRENHLSFIVRHPSYSANYMKQYRKHKRP